jgi:hypothetical protein
VAIAEWEDEEGREVLHSLNGNASLKLDHLMRKRNYQQAIDLDQNLARIHRSVKLYIISLLFSPLRKLRTLMLQMWDFLD